MHMVELIFVHNESQLAHAVCLQSPSAPTVADKHLLAAEADCAAFAEGQLVSDQHTTQTDSGIKLENAERDSCQEDCCASDRDINEGTYILAGMLQILELHLPS